jgi:hypothetical protein
VLCLSPKKRHSNFLGANCRRYLESRPLDGICKSAAFAAAPVTVQYQLSTRCGHCVAPPHGAHCGCAVVEETLRDSDVTTISLYHYLQKTMSNGPLCSVFSVYDD